jgi:hypothetical protein
MAKLLKACVFAFLEHFVPSALHFALGTKACAGVRIENERDRAVKTISNFFFISLLY